MIIGGDRDETIRLTAEALGIDEADAEAIVALELGEVSGDVIALDDDGQPVPQPE